MNTSKLPVAILVRVSSLRQETERQITELFAYAETKGYEVVEVLEESITGTAAEYMRTGLHRAEELARIGKIKKVLVHEVSRLARKNSVTHKFVENLEEHGVSLYWHSQGVETLLPNGKRSPSASLMLAILSDMARAEVENLSMRVRSGMAQAKLNGAKFGRPVGTTQNLVKKHPDIVRNLKNGQSVRNTAKITGKGSATVQRVKRIWLRTKQSQELVAA